MRPILTLFLLIAFVAGVPLRAADETTLAGSEDVSLEAAEAYIHSLKARGVALGWFLNSPDAAADRTAAYQWLAGLYGGTERFPREAFDKICDQMFRVITRDPRYIPLLWDWREMPKPFSFEATIRSWAKELHEPKYWEHSFEAIVFNPLAKVAKSILDLDAGERASRVDAIFAEARKLAEGFEQRLKRELDGQKDRAKRGELQRAQGQLRTEFYQRGIRKEIPALSAAVAYCLLISLKENEMIADQIRSGDPDLVLDLIDRFHIEAKEIMRPLTKTARLPPGFAALLANLLPSAQTLSENKELFKDAYRRGPDGGFIKIQPGNRKTYVSKPVHYGFIAAFAGVEIKECVGGGYNPEEPKLLAGTTPRRWAKHVQPGAVASIIETGGHFHGFMSELPRRWKRNQKLYSSLDAVVPDFRKTTRVDGKASNVFSVWLSKRVSQIDLAHTEGFTLSRSQAINNAGIWEVTREQSPSYVFGSTLGPANEFESLDLELASSLIDVVEESEDAQKFKDHGALIFDGSGPEADHLTLLKPEREFKDLRDSELILRVLQGKDEEAKCRLFNLWRKVALKDPSLLTAVIANLRSSSEKTRARAAWVILHTYNEVSKHTKAGDKNTAAIHLQIKKMVETKATPEKPNPFWKAAFLGAERSHITFLDEGQLRNPAIAVYEPSGPFFERLYRTLVRNEYFVDLKLASWDCLMKIPKISQAEIANLIAELFPKEKTAKVIVKLVEFLGDRAHVYTRLDLLDATFKQNKNPSVTRSIIVTLLASLKPGVSKTGEDAPEQVKWTSSDHARIRAIVKSYFGELTEPKRKKSAAGAGRSASGLGQENRDLFSLVFGDSVAPFSLDILIDIIENPQASLFVRARAMECLSRPYGSHAFRELVVKRLLALLHSPHRYPGITHAVEGIVSNAQRGIGELDPEVISKLIAALETQTHPSTKQAIIATLIDRKISHPIVLKEEINDFALRSTHDVNVYHWDFYLKAFRQMRDLEFSKPLASDLRARAYLGATVGQLPEVQELISKSIVKERIHPSEEDGTAEVRHYLRKELSSFLAEPGLTSFIDETLAKLPNLAKADTLASAARKVFLEHTDPLIRIVAFDLFWNRRKFLKVETDFMIQSLKSEHNPHVLMHLLEAAAILAISEKRTEVKESLGSALKAVYHSVHRGDHSVSDWFSRSDMLKRAFPKFTEEAAPANCGEAVGDAMEEEEA